MRKGRQVLREGGVNLASVGLIRTCYGATSFQSGGFPLGAPPSGKDRPPTCQISNSPHAARKLNAAFSGEKMLFGTYPRSQYMMHGCVRRQVWPQSGHFRVFPGAKTRQARAILRAKPANEAS